MLMLLFKPINALAQQHDEPPCITDFMQRQLLETDPSYAARRQATEEQLQRYIAEHKGIADREIITIPVVFHVVHSSEEVVNSITSAIIQSQLDVLNRDFAKTNYDIGYLPPEFAARAVNTDIQFCLARRTPSGQTTDGIVRKFGSGADSYYITGNDGNNNLSIKGTVKGSPAWDVTRYLNVWIGDLRDINNIGVIIDDALGFSYNPQDLSPSQQWRDGVALDYKYVGLSTLNTLPKIREDRNMGRTLTHEVGHYLDLLHVWGEIENPADDLCNDDDLCGDTPVQMRRNYGLPNFPHLSVPPCPSEDATGNMFMNYMDYSDDKALIAFTNDQRTRMRAAINNFRVGLKTSQGCNPITSFNPKRPCILLGAVPSSIYAETPQNYQTTVHWMYSNGSYYELWYKAQSSTNWTIAAGLPTNSYTITGLYLTEPYEVKVKHFPPGCTNGMFTSTITVTVPQLQATPTPPPADASNNIDTPTSISLNPSGTTEVNQAIATSGDVDWYTFTTTTSKPNIRVTLSNLPADYDIRVFKSPDWTNAIYYPPLYPGVTTEVVKHNTPAAATYRVQIRGFHPDDFTPYNMYKLKIEASSTGFAKQASENEFVSGGLTTDAVQFYPNPTQQYLYITLPSTQSEVVQVQLFDLMGKLSYTQAFNCNEGTNTLNLDLSQLPKGMYVAQVQSTKQSYQQKIIVH